ncbi:CopG family transcriptional regulator [Nocardioides sp.]|uniref:CopG family transcriptional regulator n=1 Tax=Nocardioides sp. TaxID=35761 RepID=UPI0039E3FFF1
MAMTLRLSDEQASALRATAEREGRSMHETVVIAIDEYVSKRERNRDALIARILDEDRDVLDRLGSV